MASLPATVTVLIGVLCGLCLKDKTVNYKRAIGLAAAATCCLLLGLVLNPVVPIAKKIWTDSFVLLSGGFALLVFAFVFWLCDVRGLKLWSYPLRVLGSNAILAFTLSQLIGDYTDKPWGIRAAGFVWLHSFIPSPNVASFAFAMLNLIFIIAILTPLYHRRIFVRI